MFSSSHSKPNSVSQAATGSRFSSGAVAMVLAGIVLLGTIGCVARSESDVVVYSALDQEFSMPILKAFERSSEDQTSVIGKFDVESTKTVGLVNEIIAESSRPVCDVFWNNEMMHTIRLQKLGLLEPS